MKNLIAFTDREVAELKRQLTKLLRFEFATREKYGPKQVKGKNGKEYTKVVGFEVREGSDLASKIHEIFTPQTIQRLGMRDGRNLVTEGLGLELRRQTVERRPGIKDRAKIQLTCLDAENPEAVFVWKIKIPEVRETKLYQNRGEKKKGKKKDPLAFMFE